MNEAGKSSKLAPVIEDQIRSLGDNLSFIISPLYLSLYIHLNQVSYFILPSTCITSYLPPSAPSRFPKLSPQLALTGNKPCVSPIYACTVAQSRGKGTWRPSLLPIPFLLAVPRNTGMPFQLLSLEELPRSLSNGHVATIGVVVHLLGLRVHHRRVRPVEAVKGDTAAAAQDVL